MKQDDRTATELTAKLADLIYEQEQELLGDWRSEQKAVIRSEYLTSLEFLDQTSGLLRSIADALAAGGDAGIEGSEWDSVRAILNDISRAWAYQGQGPTDTAIFVLSLKRGLLERIRQREGADIDGIVSLTWFADQVVDKLALFTTEVYQRSREEVIGRQQRELLELSTPVVQLWEGVVVLPLIGTLDSARTQLVMESLLQMIVDTGSTIAIIDITGVPAVDTLVAQHLLKTVAAARLMGADCIISGISPQIAQTIVHLGVALGDVTTKASLASAFALALQRRGLSITSNGSDDTRE